MLKSEYTAGLLKPIPQAIKQGLVTVIPILLMGSFACLLENLQISGYQNFIRSFAGGSILKILSFIDKSTIGMLSVYMAVAVSISYVRIANNNSKRHVSFAIASTVLACFFIMIGFFQDGVVTSVENFNSVDNINNVKELMRQIGRFSGKGMFSALIASVGGSVLFTLFTRLFRRKSSIFADGTDYVFNGAMVTILPSLCVILIFAVVNYLIMVFTGCTCIQNLFVVAMNNLFQFIGEERTWFSGFLFIFISQVMWCFGIHGSNLLEQVAADYFTEIDAYSGIVSKSFIDNFVIMGGCGTTLALIIAVLIFSKRTTTRRLSKMSLIPGIFNINELMVFGLPIVYNLYLIVPFILVPLVMYTNSYLAVYLGLVERTVNSIHWTTPIILSGYQTTNSISGSFLQIFNIVVAVLIYRPFILWYDKKSDSNSKENLNSLVDILKESEATLVPINLTELKSPAGILAKSLVNDLRIAITNEDIKIKYQPQYDDSLRCVGAESLLRWEHSNYGLLYPPLVIKLARESGILWNLEKIVMDKAVSVLDLLIIKYGENFKLSFNVTVSSFYSQEFIPFLEELKAKYNLKDKNVCIELTEEMALGQDENTSELFNKIRAMGYSLALDDFSMGHTSLQYLQNNQFDFVKIDGNLVKSMMQNSRSKDIIASIVYLSNFLDFDVIAEYVETMEEKRALKEIGCKIYQGHLFSPAVDIGELL